MELKTLDINQILTLNQRPLITTSITFAIEKSREWKRKKSYDNISKNIVNYSVGSFSPFQIKFRTQTSRKSLLNN
jgi:hypothetical protein